MVRDLPAEIQGILVPLLLVHLWSHARRDHRDHLVVTRHFGQVQLRPEPLVLVHVSELESRAHESQTIEQLLVSRGQVSSVETTHRIANHKDFGSLTSGLILSKLFDVGLTKLVQVFKHRVQTIDAASDAFTLSKASLVHSSELKTSGRELSGEVCVLPGVRPIAVDKEHYASSGLTDLHREAIVGYLTTVSLEVKSIGPTFRPRVVLVVDILSPILVLFSGDSIALIILKERHSKVSFHFANGHESASFK